MRPRQAPSDLTTEDQVNVRTALRFLRTRCGGWVQVAKALKVNESTLSNMIGGRTVSASVAFRVARFVGVAVDDVLAGRFPAPGTCPHCGHNPTAS